MSNAPRTALVAFSFSSGPSRYYVRGGGPFKPNTTTLDALQATRLTTGHAEDLARLGFTVEEDGQRHHVPPRDVNACFDYFA